MGVAEALNHMHSLTPPIVHRDIKTLNVFMDNKMQVGGIGPIAWLK